MAAPAFPLSRLGAPGGATVADVPAQVGDVTFVIDEFLRFAGDAKDRFAGGVDAERIALTGHSGGALTTLVTAFPDQDDKIIEFFLPGVPTDYTSGLFYAWSKSRDLELLSTVPLGDDDRIPEKIVRGSGTKLKLRY